MVSVRRHQTLDQRYNFNVETPEFKAAMRAIAKDIPDPHEYAHQMTLALAVAVTSATFHKNGWLLPDEETAAMLRIYGLCECRGRFLTVFGMQVRKVLMEQML